HSLALTSDGKVVAWGGNRYHQLDVPPGLTNVVAIGAGAGDCSMALVAETPGVRPSFLPIHRAATTSKLDVLGESHRSYILQTSDNLKSWSNSLTFSNLNGFVHLERPDATPAKFYRAVLVP